MAVLKQVFPLFEMVFKVSKTTRKTTLVGFDDYISKKSISIGAAATNINLPNGTIVSQMNKTQILQVGSN